MAKTILENQNTLLDLLLNESNKIPDKEGNTPLISKALEISLLNTLSEEREYYENLVCNLSDHLKDFNQTHFSELDSFINTAQLPRTKILDCFSKFVRRTELKEDITLKACVARFIINYNKAFFQLDYLKERFSELRSLDPWLYSELIIKYNWEEGVALISEILSRNNDTSYLFALITKWMIEDDSSSKLIYAFNIWEKHFSIGDKELLNALREQYGFMRDSGVDLKRYDVKNSIIIVEIIQGPAFKSFINKSRIPLQYESLA